MGVPKSVGDDEAGEFTRVAKAVDSCGDIATDERAVVLTY